MALFPFRRQPDPVLVETQARVELLEAQLKRATAQRQTMVMAPSQARADASNAMTATGPERKLLALYEAYENIPWINGPIDTIAHRMTSGGVEVVPTRSGADPGIKRAIEDLLAYCNPDEDIVEIIAGSIKDRLVFGLSESEIVEAAGQPYQLFTADPVTVHPLIDEKGNITGFVQRMEDGTKVTLTRDQVLYIPLKGPRGRTLSPIEKLKTSVVMYSHIMRFGQNFFYHGGKDGEWIDLGEGTTDEDAAQWIEKYQEFYSGAQNAHRKRILWDGAQVKSTATAGPVEMDFLQSLKYIREEFLTTLGVPPAEASISDDGNRLSDVSDSADKRFRGNTIDPLRRQTEEKWTYRICRVGFGTDDWAIRLVERDYRGTDAILKSIIDQVQNGIINRTRAAKELGYDGTIPGGDVYTLTLPGVRDIAPVSDFEHIHSGQFGAAQQSAISTGLDPHTAPSDLAQASPRDPLDASGAAHPVAVRDQQMATQPPQDDTSTPKEALDDLARWQRVVLKAVSEGKEPKPFTSAALDPVVLYAVTESLKGTHEPVHVREIFDLAFADVRG